MDSFNPDEFLAQANMAQPEPVQTAAPTQQAAGPAAIGGFDPDQFLADANEEQYGGIGQQVITGLEGAAEGIAGPIAPLFEKHVLGIDDKDIKGRAETNSLLHGTAKAATLIGSTIAGVGLGGAMTGAGKLAMEAAGVANVAKEAGLGFKIGSSAVQQAAEMAVLQGSDEVSKQILNDPSATAESAISNIGLAAALGAGGGAFFTGAVSPLWKATAGPQVEKVLNMVKNRVDGVSVLPEAREQAIKTLGIEVDPAVRSAISDNPTARSYAATLKRGENKDFLAGIGKLEADASDSVAKSMNLSPDDVLRYDQADAGHNLFNTFEKEYKAKYQPVADALEKRNAEAAGITIADDAKLDQYNRLIERSMEKLRPGSEYGKIYEKYAEELLPLDTIGHLDQLRTEIFNKAKGMQVGGDRNVIDALHDIRNVLGEFQENQISKIASKSEQLGVDGAMRAGADLVSERQAANQGYAKFANMSNELSNHLGTGDFRGFKGLTNKLENKVTAESLLKKFSIKNNADLVPFLQQHFPETLEAVLANERQQLIKPAVLSAAKKGENPIDIKKLSDIINKQMTERSSYVDAIISKDTLSKIEAAKTLAQAMPNPRDSGTPAGLAKLFEWMPTSALAAVGWMTGHNPLVGAMIGHTTGVAGHSLPEAYKLGYLKFLGSNEPIKAEGFRSMVDFFNSTYKAENAFAKGVKNLFKGSAQVLASSAIPSESDRERIDKIVDKSMKDPGSIMSQQASSTVGHYLPQHQAAMTQTVTGALSYLQKIKPQPFKPGPLDKPIDPSPAQKTRYERALNIAQNPMTVLEHIKNGTLQTTDIQDLMGMYPSLYKQMALKVSNEMASAQAKGENIPYKTRLSLGLFLHQPLDVSMQPSSIMAAQPQPRQQPNQMGGSTNGRPSALKDKSVKMYQTPGQAAESDRGSRD